MKDDFRLLIDDVEYQRLCDALAWRFHSAGPQVELTSATLGAAKLHRVHALLLVAVRNGAAVVDDALLTALHEQVAAGLHTSLLAEEAAVIVATTLERVGIDVRVLKGIAIAHLDHPDPAERMFGDADLLVAEHDLAAAVTALASEGFTREVPAIRGWWERRFAKAVVLRAPNGAEVDLHIRLCDGYYGYGLDMKALWNQHPDDFELAGGRLRGLDRPNRLLHACYHGVLGGGSGLRALHDIAQLLAVGTDWQTTVDRAGRSGASGLVSEALMTTATTFEVSPGHPAIDWAAHHRHDAAESAALAARGPARSGDGWRSDALGGIAALGPVSRILFVSGLAFPSRSFLAARHRTRRSHLERIAGRWRTRPVNLGPVRTAGRRRRR